MTTVPSDESPAPAIAAAVIVRHGKVLLVKRRVAEGKLSWQFPAGGIEEGETADAAAVREAYEETGLFVQSLKHLGERVHPTTGRRMIYIACDVVQGDASVMDDEELTEFTWATLNRLSEYVPHGVFEPVQVHLNSVLAP